MKRPFGVTLIAILALIGALFGLFWAILAFTGGALFGGFFGTLSVVAGIFLVVGPLLQLAFAFGAFGLRSWAWYLGLISSGVTVLGVIVSLFEGSSFTTAVCGSLFPIIVFIYLLTPNVRQAFGIGSAGEVPASPPPPAAPPPSAPPTPMESSGPPDDTGG